MMLFTLFAVLGLALALAGIYSVLSYLVSMRTREIGVRIALGAKAVDIVQMILRVGGKLVGAGILIGLILSVIAARLLGSQMNLFRVTSTDPLSFIVVAVLIAAVAAAACLIPARQATKVGSSQCTSGLNERRRSDKFNSRWHRHRTASKKPFRP